MRSALEANTLTIRVQRAALAKGQRCYDAKVSRYISVIGSVTLHFAADLPRGAVRQGSDSGGQECRPGLQGTFTGAARFMNNGPSSSLAGDVRIDFYTAYGVQTFIAKDYSAALSPCVGCNWDNASPGGGTAEATCTYADLKAGEQAPVNLVIGYVVGPSFPANAVHRVTLSWEIASTTSGKNPGLGHYMTQAVWVLCGPAATDPACS